MRTLLLVSLALAIRADAGAAPPDREPLPAVLLSRALLSERGLSPGEVVTLSLDPRGAEQQGVSVRFWDFLFYASFGFVVTSSVAIAGVLLVFCYLIVPSVGAMLYAERIGPRLAIGWTMGTLVSGLGVCLSMGLDLPTGAAIVCTFGIVLVLMAAVRGPVLRALESKGSKAAAAVPRKRAGT